MLDFNLDYTVRYDTIVNGVKTKILIGDFRKLNAIADYLIESELTIKDIPFLHDFKEYNDFFFKTVNADTAILEFYN